jgi:DNA-binding LacI/PurR family transcriptional regulator
VRREGRESTRQGILQVARPIRYNPNLAARALFIAKGSARPAMSVVMPDSTCTVLRLTRSKTSWYLFWSGW